jgi:hypothetical protein
MTSLMLVEYDLTRDTLAGCTEAQSRPAQLCVVYDDSVVCLGLGRQFGRQSVHMKSELRVLWRRVHMPDCENRQSFYSERLY